MAHAVKRFSLKQNQNESWCILIRGKSCVFRSITPGCMLRQSNKTDKKMPLIPEDACLPEDGRGVSVDFCQTRGPCDHHIA